MLGMPAMIQSWKEVCFELFLGFKFRLRGRGCANAFTEGTWTWMEEVAEIGEFSVLVRQAVRSFFGFSWVERVVCNDSGVGMHSMEEGVVDKIELRCRGESPHNVHVYHLNYI